MLSVPSLPAKFTNRFSFVKIPEIVKFDKFVKSEQSRYDIKTWIFQQIHFGPDILPREVKGSSYKSL